MNNTLGDVGKKSSSLVKFMYAVSAILAVIFVYIAISNVLYINDYVASYGMSFGDMWIEAIQYIVTGSVSYFVYALLVFCAAKILNVLSFGMPEHKHEEVIEEDAGEEISPIAAAEEKSADRPRKQQKKRR